MVKQIIEKNENVLPNSREMDVLKQNFPSCFNVDGSFDIERFKEFLKDKVNVTKEGYELKFLGKNYARLLASVDTTTVIVPDEENNNKPENKDSENIYITGDNLDALKHLLQSYAGKIKCIYIDPPYNTGSDGFVYNDSFNFTAEDLAVKLSIDEEQAKRILDLTKRGSASHSAWLMFMYPRLLLARDLLSDDGVIFISIDDNEQSNLKLLCDDVFGEQNFVTNIAWQNLDTVKNDTKYFSDNYENILVYSRDKDKTVITGLKKDEKQRKYYKNFDDDDRGDYLLTPLHAKSGSSENIYSYTFKNGQTWTPPQGTFPRFSKETLKKLEEDNRIYLDPDRKNVPQKKTFFTEVGDRMPPISFWDYSSFGSTRQSNKELSELIGNGIFQNPKPTKLLKIILDLLNDNSLVLDFFSGSATTAHAVMQLNAEDGGKRKFVMVQLPEQVKADSEAERAGYKTIDQIGRERIRRAAAKIKAEHPGTTADLGFKHYVLQEPQGETLDKLEKFVPEEENGAFLNNDIFGQFGLPTVLTTWLVRDGYGLNAKPQELDFAGYKGYYIGQHLYLIEEGLTDEAVTAIVAKYDDDGCFNPDKIVVFGYNFLWTKLQALKDNLSRLKDTEKNIRIVFDVRY